MVTEVDYYKNLSSVMYKTRGCRFSASDVLRTKDVFSVSTIAFLSIYLLGLAIVALAYPEIITSSHSRFYGAIGAIASAALLVISLMDFSFSRAVAAERLEQNALEVSSLMRALERELASPKPRIAELKRLAEAYEELNRRTATNHTDADYRHWLTKSKRFKSRWARVIYGVYVAAYEIVYYARAMIAHLCLVMIILASTLWYTIVYLLPSLGAG